MTTGAVTTGGTITAINPTADNNTQNPSPCRMFFIVLSVCSAAFLTALDQTIIATAVPTITDEFSALNDAGWYVSGYMLTLCSFQLVFGNLWRVFGQKQCFIASIVVFEIGSLICGLAPMSEVFIFGRAIAGLGAAGISIGTTIIPRTLVPLRDAPMMDILPISMWTIASGVGPLVGGAFTDHIGWRWCFYINIPIGSFAMVLVAICLTSPPPPLHSAGISDVVKSIDFPGTVVLVAGITCFVLFLQWGGTVYPWNSPKIIALLACAVTLLAAFGILQVFLGEKAGIPPRIFKRRSVFCGSLVTLFNSSSYMVLTFYLPIWFQSVQGVSATQSGLRNLPLILGVSFSSIFSAGVLRIIGYYKPIMILGAALGVVGTALLTLLQVDTGFWGWFGYQAIIGVGIGLVMQLPVTAAQVKLDKDDFPFGVSSIMFFRTLGGICFTSIGQNIFTQSLIQGFVKALPGLDPAIVISAGTTSLQGLYPTQLPTVIQIYNDALRGCFYAALAAAAAGFILCFGMEWGTVKSNNNTSCD